MTAITRTFCAFLFVLSSLALTIPIIASGQDVKVDHSAYYYVELGGKGFVSANVDWHLRDFVRLTAGLTLLDYDLAEMVDAENHKYQPLPSPSVMIFLLNQNKGSYHYIEAGAGLSINPLPWRDFAPNDSALSLHGSIGYRYQKPDGKFFRIGFTPFYRVNWAFLPLIGISYGRHI